MGSNFTINQISKEKRPRERMIKEGSRGLNDKDLLVALLGRGSPGESVVVTVQRLWGKFKNIDRISNASIEELSTIKGIGPAKAAQIKSAFELGLRAVGAKESKSAEPFLKWVGGKAQLVNQM